MVKKYQEYMFGISESFEEKTELMDQSGWKIIVRFCLTEQVLKNDRMKISF